MSSEDKIIAEPLANLFGKPMISRLFSKNWSLRAQSIIGLDKELETFDQSSLFKEFEQEEIYVGIFQIIAQGLKDKVIQVNSDAIVLFINYVEGKFKNVTKFTNSEQRVEYGKAMNQIIDSMISKLGDSHPKLKEQCATALMVGGTH